MADKFRRALDDDRIIDDINQYGMAGVALRSPTAPPPPKAPIPAPPDAGREARYQRAQQNQMSAERNARRWAKTGGGAPGVSRINPTMYVAPDGVNLGRINPANLNGMDVDPQRLQRSPGWRPPPPPPAPQAAPSPAPAPEIAAPKASVRQRVTNAAKSLGERAKTASSSVRESIPTVRGVRESALKAVSPRNLASVGLDAAKAGGGYAVSALRKVGPAAGVALEGKDVYDVLNDDASTKADVFEQATIGAGRLAAAGLGGQVGASIGAFGGPLAPVTVPLGAVVGAGAGYVAGDEGLRKLREWAGGQSDTPEEQRLKREQAKADAALRDNPWSKPLVQDRPEDYGFGGVQAAQPVAEEAPYALRRRDPTRYNTQGLQPMDFNLDTAQVANRGGGVGAVIEDPALKDAAKRKLSYDLQEISRSGMQMKEKRLLMQGLVEQYQQDTGNEFAADQADKTRAQQTQELNARIDENNASRRFNASKFGKEQGFERDKYNNALTWDQEKAGSALDWDKEKSDIGESLKRRELATSLAGETAKARAEYAAAQAEAGQKAREEVSKAQTERYNQIKASHPDWSDEQITQAIAIEALKTGAGDSLTDGAIGAAGYRNVREGVTRALTENRPGAFSRVVHGDSVLPGANADLVPGQAVAPADLSFDSAGLFPSVDKWFKDNTGKPLLPGGDKSVRMSVKRKDGLPTYTYLTPEEAAIYEAYKNLETGRVN